VFTDTFSFVLHHSGSQALKPESVYEGIRSQQKSNNVVKVTPKQTLPSYQEYDNEQKSINYQ
jgi:hypothetical protein